MRSGDYRRRKASARWLSFKPRTSRSPASGSLSTWTASRKLAYHASLVDEYLPVWPARMCQCLQPIPSDDFVDNPGRILTEFLRKCEKTRKLSLLLTWARVRGEGDVQAAS